MTPRTNARVAGATFLLYIILGLTSLAIGRGAMTGDTGAAKLASMAQHAAALRLEMLLAVVLCFVALALAVSLYGITRHVDHELSVFAMCCRVAEAFFGIAPLSVTVTLLNLATGEHDAASEAFAVMLLRLRAANPTFTAVFFSVGSTVFGWLLLRGRVVPGWLARLGVLASVLLVVVLPAQLAGYIDGGGVWQVVWLPMLVFEVTLAFWLIIRGAATPVGVSSFRA